MTSSAGRGGEKQQLSAQAGRELLLLLHAPAAAADEAAVGGSKAAEDFAGGQAMEPRLGQTTCRSGQQRGKELAKRSGLCSC